MTSFKENYTLEKRCAESKKIKERYPDRIPIIVEASDSLELDKHKYLVPLDLTMGHFQFVLRKRMKQLKESEAIFVFCNNSLTISSATLGKIYDEHRDEDGFLYMEITKESTFG